MRFDVVSLAFALAAPALAENVGWRVGQNQNGPVPEYDPSTATTAVAATTPVANPANAAATTPVVSQQKNQFGGSDQIRTHVLTSAAGHITTAPQVTNAEPTSQANKASPTSQAIKGSATTAAKASATPTSGGSGSGTVGSGGSAPNGGQILYIVNKYGENLNIVTGNSGGPTPAGGKPSLASGETATITLSSGWAGRFAVNPTSVPAGNELGTKIEGALADQPYWDISLVDGYTVPITCTCDSNTTPFIGCNIDLFKQSAKCPSPSGQGLCLNPARDSNNGPADPWFAACKDADYTYPDNDIATQTCSGNAMTCCVGTSCAAGKNQHKRGISPVYARWAFPRSAFAEN